MLDSCISTWVSGSSPISRSAPVQPLLSSVTDTSLAPPLAIQSTSLWLPSSVSPGVWSASSMSAASRPRTLEVEIPGRIAASAPRAPKMASRTGVLNFAS